jgi:hypothetical protein
MPVVFLCVFGNPLMQAVVVPSHHQENPLLTSSHFGNDEMRFGSFQAHCKIQNPDAPAADVRRRISRAGSTSLRRRLRVSSFSAEVHVNPSLAPERQQLFQSLMQKM